MGQSRGGVRGQYLESRHRRRQHHEKEGRKGRMKVLKANSLVIPLSVQGTWFLTHGSEKWSYFSWVKS